MTRHRFVHGSLFAILLLAYPPLWASDYVIDTQEAHAFIQFKIPHLGYSWLLGRFNDFQGHFSYDPKHPERASVEVVVQTASLDSNHAERDKHLRGRKYLDVRHYPEARFVSTSYHETADGSGELQGQLTLKGVTRPITITTRQIGAGMDPWGGYRRGFEGHTQLRLADFGIDTRSLGPASELLELGLYVEGIRANKPARRPKH